MLVHSPALSSAITTTAGARISAMDALYGAALGPVQAARNRALFERFDQAGRARIGWNLAASLVTLNWMVLHRLWNAALVYVAAVEGMALLIFGAGRNWLNWPESVHWGLMAGFALFAFVLPGMFGDALLYGDTKKRIAQALGTARTMPDACALLARRASSWRRLQWIAVGNLVLLGVLGALWFLLPLIVMNDSSAPSTAADAGRVESAMPPTAAHAAPALERPAPVPTPALVAPALSRANVFQPPRAPEARAGSGGEPASAMKPAAAKSPDLQMAASAPIAPTHATSPSARDSGTGTTQDIAAHGATAPTADKPGAPTTPVPAASRGKSKPSASAATETSRRQADAADARKPARSDTVASPAQTTARLDGTGALGSAPGYYLNVGVFAEEANARRAQAQLLNAGLPAFRNPIDTRAGPRTRVRVGPFATDSEARKAATATRALGLDAVAYRQSAP